MDGCTFVLQHSACPPARHSVQGRPHVRRYFMMFSLLHSRHGERDAILLRPKMHYGAKRVFQKEQAFYIPSVGIDVNSLEKIFSTYLKYLENYFVRYYV